MKIHSQEFLLRSPKLAAIVAAGGLALTGCGSEETDSLNASKPSSAEPVHTAPSATTTESTTDSQPTQEIPQTEADPMIVELLCELGTNYQGPAFDKKVADAFTEETESIRPDIITAEEFRAAAELARYYSFNPESNGFDTPITPDTVLPYPETFRAEFRGENC